MAVEFITVVWRMSPYRAEKLIVHLALADWADLHGQFYPTYREIASKARISKQGAIGIVKAMIEDKEIEIIQNGGGRGSKNLYRFAEKYRAAVAELSEKWATKRAERVKQDDPFSKRVKDVDPLKKVKDVDPLSKKRVNENEKKGQRERKHIRNKPSCMPVMHETVMQQHAEPSKNAAAANPSGEVKSESHASRFTFPEIRAYCETTKKHAWNPAGLARYLYRTGEEDERIAAWIEQEKERAEARKSKPTPAEESFDLDQYIAGLIAAGDEAHLRDELDAINQRGGPSADWERKVVTYFEQRGGAIGA